MNKKWGWIIDKIIPKLKLLEKEHVHNIKKAIADIQRLRIEESRLRDALEVLKLNNLSIPPECSSKLRGYEEQIKSLQEHVRQEKMLLDYLHRNFFKREFNYSHDLFAIAIITLLIDAAIFATSFEEIIFRIIALPVLLLFPGYVLLAIIFPNIEHLDMIERTAFSLVLSIVVMLLLSFALSGSAVKTVGLLIAINIIIFTCLGIATLRRYREFSFLKRIKPVESGN
ncbi:MAG: DUF1616 domain-containing protein [Methanocellales archaeon]